MALGTRWYVNTIPTKGGRFCPPLQRSQLKNFHGYVPEIGKVNEKKIRLKNLIIGKKVITDRLDLCVTSFVGSLELLESEQEKAESDCAIHQNQCSQSSLTRNNYPSPLHRPSLPQKITSGGCINKHLLTLNGKSINEADDDDFLHAIM